MGKFSNQLHKNIKKLTTSTQDNMELAMNKSIKIMSAEAKSLCPVDTGQLRNSIMTDSFTMNDKTYGEVYTNCEHGVYVEFGTGQRGSETNQNEEVEGITYRADWKGQVAQPFMYPAYKNTYKDVIITFGKEIGKANKL